MEKLSKADFDKFICSKSLLLDKCENVYKSKFDLLQSDNPLLSNQGDIDAASANIYYLKEVLLDFIRLVAEERVDYWSGYFIYTTIYDYLYKRRSDEYMTDVCLWVGRGLVHSIRYLKGRLNAQQHTPFLVKYISLLEKNNYYQDAIELCDYAINSMIPDISVKGYAGRKKRIEGKMEKNKNNNQYVNWKTVQDNVQKFYSTPYAETNLSTQAIDKHISEIKCLCEQLIKLPLNLAIDEFQRFKLNVVPQILVQMKNEDEHQIRSTGKSYSWLLKELFHLEAGFWFWCDAPYLMWCRDTKKVPDVWPEWLIDGYGSGRRIEFKLQQNNIPFTADELYSITVINITDWGLGKLRKIINEADNLLLSYREKTGQCIIRGFFSDPSYWKIGRINKVEEEKLDKSYKELFSVGALSFGKNIEYISSVDPETRMFFGAWGNPLYTFPVVKSSCHILPDISKLILDTEIRELFRIAENNVRSYNNLPEVGKGWISETELFESIKQYFSSDKVVQHARPPWLGQQHFDVYFPDYNLAIEYQGIQHYEAVDIFGGEEGLKKTQERDEKKRLLSRKNMCSLIYVHPDYVLEPLIYNIEETIVKQRILINNRDFDAHR